MTSLSPSNPCSALAAATPALKVTKRDSPSMPRSMGRSASAARMRSTAVTALSPVIGYDKASKIAHYAMDNDLTLKAAALKLGFVTEAEFDRVVDPKKMVQPYVAAAAQ